MPCPQAAPLWTALYSRQTETGTKDSQGTSHQNYSHLFSTCPGLSRADKLVILRVSVLVCFPYRKLILTL